MCTHAHRPGPRSHQQSSLRFPALSQHSGALSPVLPRSGVCALVFNVHINLGCLMGMELARGGWLARSSRNLASPALGFHAHTTMSCVLVALNVGARDPTQVPMLGQYTPDY